MSDKKEKIFWAFISLSLLLVIWFIGSQLDSMKNLLPNPIHVFKYLITSAVVPIGKYTIWGHIA